MIFRCLATALLLAITGNATAGPDEEFTGVVKLIQHGDQLIEQGSDRPAMDEYRKAQEALLKFRKVYPDWDNQVVSFRLRYLGERLGNWSEPDQVDKPATDASVEAMRSRINFLERSGQQYQAQINQLLSENNRLSGRLREALAIRPAAENPAVVAETRTKLETAESEITQLRSQIKKLETELAGIPKPEEARKNARLVDELRENLNHTLADAESLRKQNADLREAIKQATAPQPSKEASSDQRLLAQVTQSAAEIEIKRLQADNERLQTQLLAKQKESQVQEQKPARDPKGFNPMDRARMALANNQSDEAISVLSTELETHPDNTEGWYLMGRARLARDDYAEAETALKRALSLAPELGAAHFELARLFVRRSPPDLALARWHYHKAIELNFPRDKSLEHSLNWEQPGSSR